MLSARSTTLPIMMIAGDFIFSRFTFDAMFETVPEIILWRAVVPSCMTATGVFLSMPPDKSCLQITPIRARPIIIRFDGSSCPVWQRQLSMIPKKTQRLYVGRVAGDDPSNQDTTNEMMVKYAKKGKKVLRLKGGDPAMFGRGGEEAEYLKSHKDKI